jgi:hypothetical protein
MSVIRKLVINGCTDLYQVVDGAILKTPFNPRKFFRSEDFYEVSATLGVWDENPVIDRLRGDEFLKVINAAFDTDFTHDNFRSPSK